MTPPAATSRDVHRSLAEVHTSRAPKEWWALQDALSANRGDIPCQVPVLEPLWRGGSLEDARDAASWCQGCPVLAECGTYATAASERTGVWGGVVRGWDNPRQRPHTKLTEASIPQLRAWTTYGFSNAAVGRMFGVKPKTVSAIKLRERWRHV